MPTTHDAVTLGQVMQYNKINADPIAVCRLFCKGDVNELTMAEAERISATMIELINAGQPVFKPFIEIGEIQYGFHPDLNAVAVGEFVDMEEFCKSPTDHAHDFMAVVYRPVKRRIANRYEIESYQPGSIDHDPDVFKSVPFSVYRGALAFFLTLAAGFATNLAKYLASQPSEAMTTTAEGSQATTKV